ncbi:MAG: hypothetical protein RLP09_09470 [Sandaracinaceae bacterium]
MASGRFARRLEFDHRRALEAQPERPDRLGERGPLPVGVAVDDVPACVVRDALEHVLPRAVRPGERDERVPEGMARPPLLRARLAVRDPDALEVAVERLHRLVLGPRLPRAGIGAEPVVRARVPAVELGEALAPPALEDVGERGMHRDEALPRVLAVVSRLERLVVVLAVDEERAQV